jgi:rfaE bifunctional protein nucleotidyltransferase chain/domain
MNWIELINDKIHEERKSLSQLVQQWKSFNEKIVFTNGCFDILHMGHLDYLCKAAELGDRLIIGLNTDASVKRLKGNVRPVIEQSTRAFKLASLAYVDAVIAFDEDNPYDLIFALKPDILVKGGDYSEEDVIGGDIVKSDGGEVKIIPFMEGQSTSLIIERILQKGLD